VAVDFVQTKKLKTKVWPKNLATTKTNLNTCEGKKNIAEFRYLRKKKKKTQDLQKIRKIKSESHGPQKVRFRDATFKPTSS